MKIAWGPQIFLQPKSHQLLLLNGITRVQNLVLWFTVVILLRSAQQELTLFFSVIFPFFCANHHLEILENSHYLFFSIFNMLLFLNLQIAFQEWPLTQFKVSNLLIKNLYIVLSSQGAEIGLRKFTVSNKNEKKLIS